MSTHDDDPRAELRNVEGRLAALTTWASNHPESDFRHPHIPQLRARARTLTTQIRSTDMHNIEIPRQYLAGLQDELRAIHTAAGNRALTPQQQARWTELEADADEVSRTIADLEKKDARAAHLAAERARWGSLQVGGPTPAPADPADALRMDAGTARDHALRQLDTAAHLDDRQREHVDALLRRESSADYDAGALARHVVLTNSEDYRSAFRKVTGPSMSTIVTLSEREAAVMGAVQRASMAEGVGATGGFAVPAFLDPTIVLNAQGAANPIRKLARNETITTKQWKGVGTSGVTWAFVGEGEASTDSSPTVSQPTVDVHTARAWITYSIELQQDAVELDRQLLRLLGNGWEETVAGVLATGTGIGEPKGIITALDAVAASEVQLTAAGTLAPADLSKVWVSLPDRAREAASWIMSESVREHIAGWGDEFGNRTVDLGGRLSALRGRPVYSTEKFPAVVTTTASTNQLVVGDLTGYLVAQRAGMTVEPVQTVVNGDGLPTGQRGLFAWARIGANVVDPGLLRLLQQ